MGKLAGGRPLIVWLDRKHLFADAGNVVEHLHALVVDMLKHGHGENEVEALITIPGKDVFGGANVDRVIGQLGIGFAEQRYGVWADLDGLYVGVTGVEQVGDVSACIAAHFEYLGVPRKV